jgi:hypothetical protein
LFDLQIQIPRDFKRGQHTDYVLSFFGQNRYRRRKYQQYVQKGVALGRRPELVGGELVRSLSLGSVGSGVGPW